MWQLQLRKGHTTPVLKCQSRCRLYQTFLKESAERIKAKPAVSKTGQSKPASVREAGLRAAIMAPLTSHVAVETGQPSL